MKMHQVFKTWTGTSIQSKRKRGITNYGNTMNNFQFSWQHFKLKTLHLNAMHLNAMHRNALWTWRSAVTVLIECWPIRVTQERQYNKVVLNYVIPTTNHKCFASFLIIVSLTQSMSMHVIWKNIARMHRVKHSQSFNIAQPHMVPALINKPQAGR